MIRALWLRAVNELQWWLLFRVVARRSPDFVVGADSPDGAYLRRWWLTPWSGLYRDVADAQMTHWQRFVSKLPGIYLHEFLRDDDDRALHDHPWASLSLLLFGSYIEHTVAEGGIHQRRRFDQGALRFRGAKFTHRIELLASDVAVTVNGRTRGQPRRRTCWTLFIVGFRVRSWGFHCPARGWVPWRTFTAAGKPGETGAGCDA